MKGFSVLVTGAGRSLSMMAAVAMLGDNVRGRGEPIVIADNVEVTIPPPRAVASTLRRAGTDPTPPKPPKPRKPVSQADWDAINEAGCRRARRNAKRAREARK